MPERWRQARERAITLDRDDPLAPVRELFDLPRGSESAAAVYCCGHSLGPRPKRAAAFVQEILNTWGEHAVEGHFLGEPSWSEYAAPLARASANLCGAEASDVTVMHSLTVNLHLMLASFYRPRGERNCILIEQPAFPSDRYAAVSHLRWHGFDPATTLLQVGPRPGEVALREEDLPDRIAAAGPRLALVLLGGVNYYTGQAFDLAAVTRAAHAAGALVGFDLAHAAGNVAINLESAGPDFAVWCGYKYLCGGPGAPAACYVHRRHGQETERFRLAGWWGNRADTRFEMREAFEPEAGAAGWNVSCPSLLALAGLKAGLEVYAQAAPAAWQAKRQALGDAFAGWMDQFLPTIRRITPPAHGAQWSLDLGENVKTVHQQLRAAGIYSDTRGPVLRVSFHPLYNRFQDALAVVKALANATVGR